MQNKINLGIIGKNFGYHVIYKSFLKNKKYKIKGFAFKSKKTEKIKIPKTVKIYSSWKKLILDKKINAVVIAAPPILHKSIIKFAIKNNKHVFCEKPPSRTSEEMLKVMEVDGINYLTLKNKAGVVELVYTTDLKSVGV